MVVSQPGKPKGRGNKAVPVPSPVEQLARDHGFGNDQILVPIKARDVSTHPSRHVRTAMQAWHTLHQQCILCISG